MNSSPPPVDVHFCFSLNFFRWKQNFPFFALSVLCFVYRSWNTHLGFHCPLFVRFFFWPVFWGALLDNETRVNHKWARSPKSVLCFTARLNIFKILPNKKNESTLTSPTVDFGLKQWEQQLLFKVSLSDFLPETKWAINSPSSLSLWPSSNLIPQATVWLSLTGVSADTVQLSELSFKDIPSYSAFLSQGQGGVVCRPQITLV